jgi:hypothetical protein
MARIKDAKPKNQSGAYERLFDNKELGDLITKVQSTVISNGSELENIILSVINKDFIVNDFDLFLENYKKTDLSAGDIVRVVPKRVMKKSLKLSTKKDKVKHEPDFVVLKIDVKEECCYIIELKDGFTFDTKKVAGEKMHLEEFENYIAKQIPYSTRIKFCCFNELDKEKIKIGLKGVFDIDEIMTGEEFCDLIKINYDNIINMRKDDAKENLEYFVSELLKISAIRNLLQ